MVTFGYVARGEGGGGNKILGKTEAVGTLSVINCVSEKLMKLKWQCKVLAVKRHSFKVL